MQILHLFDEYNSEHLDIVQTIDDALELLPVTVHRMNSRLTEDIMSLLGSWSIRTPASLPAILLIWDNRDTYIYPDMYDTAEQLIGSILDFFGVDY